MSEPKRLHPAGMILDILLAIRHSILGFLPVVAIALANSEWLILGIGAAVFLGLIIVSGVLSWWRFTYQLEEDQIRIEKGIFIRKKRTISKHRIQSIDLSQNIVHRMFGLTKVQIDTAGNDNDIDAALSAVTMADGKMIHDQLKYKKRVEMDEIKEESGEITEEVEAKPKKKYPSKKITLQTLVAAGSTSGSFGIILGLFGVFFSSIESFIPDRYYTQATEWLISQAAQLLVIYGVITLLIVWLIGILQTVIQHWNFTITRYDKELFITRGLLEKKQSTIPLKKIQAVGMKESIVRQPLGLASLYVEIASGDIGQTQDTHTLIFPLMRKKHITKFLQEILPEYHYTTEGLVKLPTRALPYYIVRSIILPTIVTIVFAFTLTKFVWIPALAILLFVVYAYIQFKTTGYLINGREIIIQSRMLTKDTAIVPQNRIQSLQKKQHLLHRKQKLATLDASILSKFMGRHFIVRELRQEDVDRIADWYSFRDKAE
ncbi:PH domain-containing protein [Gracilibacillus sp. S3-1-1]|uniref:PH domain-containing protein n=1 Tax=Gracilibacillus pellucidus TaxID=3095368 RepID=A0ACC6M0L0_9BACI|nr:PH domain-containing protein [Gracilibacillus sp. S3-1-1]MDX8044484.1 PH domain-containing protein [Gracilibacillus sp. S3-1-1]